VQSQAWLSAVATASAVRRPLFRTARWRGVSPLLSAPAIAIAVATLLPLVYLIIRTADAGSDAWDLLARVSTFQVLGRSALLAALVTGTATLVALPLAWLTVRTDLPGRRIFSVLTALPLVVPSYVGAMAVASALGPRGLLQQALEGPFGIERMPDIYGLPGAWLTLTLFTYPYILLSIRASLWGMDPALEEASRSLGHGARSTFFRVTLPHLRPAIAAGALLVALYTLSDFGAVSLLRYDSFTRAIFLQYEASFDRTLASVLALLLVVFTVSLVLAEQRARGRAVYHSTSGVKRPPLTIRLGRWRWPGAAFCSAVVLVALGLPISVLFYWLAQGLSNDVGLDFLGGAMLDSVYASGLAAIVAVAAAIPIAVLAVRFPSRRSRAIEGAAYLGFAMPGLVVALSLVFFGANYARPLYQTITMLVFAYLVMFLPMALGAVRSTLLQVSPAVEEAARSLGRSPLRVLATVTLPLVWPGIMAGAALVFLTTMKELPATLLLAPLGFDTLATKLWSSADGAYFAQAAVPGLLLIGVSFVPVALLLSRERGHQEIR
jgi:iron(III) transport system permease protein